MKLNPCSCGGEAGLVSEFDMIDYIKCVKCGKESKRFYDGPEFAADNWNGKENRPCFGSRGGSQENVLAGKRQMSSEYRYTLTREWGDGHKLLWIMLNPSTADDLVDDPTIRRVINFSKSFGYYGCEVVNLFAARATNPKDLWKMENPKGDLNIGVLEDAFWRYPNAVAAWGAAPYANKLGRQVEEEVVRLARKTGIDLFVLEETKNGYPRHPLYMKNDSELYWWN